jgi:hypothetical protein
MPETHELPAEIVRLLEDNRHERFWKFWGPYVSERQWGTVREDYSADGDVWTSFPHEHARSRTYRWGEDGLLGFCDRFGRLCFALALWNGKDPILKERLFGLTGPQGNHGEDVKELYYYLDSTPTHSYAKALYKYPQAAFPYGPLVTENARRSRNEREYELLDTGVFDGNRYFDVFTEYAKLGIEDILIRITVANRGPEDADIHVLPTLWYRNTWAWGEIREECTTRPEIAVDGPGRLIARHEVMGAYVLDVEVGPGHEAPNFLFTENETNTERLYGVPNAHAYVKDGFHDAVVDGDASKVNPAQTGTKAAAHHVLRVAAGREVVLRLRLRSEAEALKEAPPFDASFDDVFAERIREADEFYASRIEGQPDLESRHVARQAYAGLMWSKQFYNLVQVEWTNGDSTSPPPPAGHMVRNADWENLFNRDVISMPDKWEYPYYCSWDLAFHTVSLMRIDPFLAKGQLNLFLREWYMHPNGQIPAYEWNFSDVNPPVHAWAAWRAYRLPWGTQKENARFLEGIFQKLLLNFTWWVNRKDPDDNNLFSGGFLGLDNIGVFDRSKPLPTGGQLKQADGTAWMAFYCVQMLSMALELAQTEPVYEDMASKFFEHFVRIMHAINELGGTGLWNEEDGFYYDLLEVDGRHEPLRIRSIVGFMPLLAVTIIPNSYSDKLKEFAGRVQWFVKNHKVLVHHLVETNAQEGRGMRLLAIATREHLQRILQYMFDEDEFLSPFGIRSVSKRHEKEPYTYWAHGTPYSVDYEPGEGTSGMFGGNSNWRGPIWFPINYLLIEALRTYHRFYGETFVVEFPTRSGNHVTLGEAARLLSQRLISIFLPDASGQRPCHGGEERYASDPHWKDLLQFNEYFHAETGRGCGASHQTGWTALITDLLNLRAHWDIADEAPDVESGDAMLKT